MPTSLFPLPAIHFLTSPSVLPSPCRARSHSSPFSVHFIIRSSLLSISVFFLRVSFFLFTRISFFFSFTVFLLLFSYFLVPFLFLPLYLSSFFFLLTFLYPFLSYILPSFLFFPFFATPIYFSSLHLSPLPSSLPRSSHPSLSYLISRMFCLLYPSSSSCHPLILSLSPSLPEFQYMPNPLPSSTLQSPSFNHLH